MVSSHRVGAVNTPTITPQMPRRSTSEVLISARQRVTTAAKKAVVELDWQCPSCGKPDNKGRSSDCANCGAPKPWRANRHLPSDSPSVEAELSTTDGEEPTHTSSSLGDWDCPICHQPNGGERQFCHFCRHTREGYSFADVRYAEPGDALRPAAPLTEAQMQFTALHNRLRPIGESAMHYVGWLAALGGMALVCLLGWMFFSTTRVEMRVEQLSYMYEATLYEHQVFEDTSPNPPSDVTITTEFEGVVGRESVLDGYDDEEYWGVVGYHDSAPYDCGPVYDGGDGYLYQDQCVDEVPDYGWICCNTTPITHYENVYGPVYGYTFLDWVAIDNVEISGTYDGTTKPQCPSLDQYLAILERKFGPCQKSHAVRLRGIEDQTETREVTDLDEQTWLAQKPGNVVIVEQNRFGATKSVRWS